MRRVLVPLDGSRLAETILPDALRLAGLDGELILIRDGSWVHVDVPLEEYGEWHAIEETDQYLDTLAQRLEQTGRRATAYRVTASDIATAIDDTASRLEVDMVACATHGRGPVGRLVFGGVVWRALTESRLPVLLRHPPEEIPQASQDGRDGSKAASPLVDVGARRIMVPLDGSSFAEASLPLARTLATEWKAPVHLVRVVPDPSLASAVFGGADQGQEEVDAARVYLSQVATRLTGDAHTGVLAGSPVTRLVDAIDHWGITDVVMTSHGRTGLKRAILGSVADELIERVHCPTIIIPPLAVASQAAAGPPALSSEQAALL